MASTHLVGHRDGLRLRLCAWPAATATSGTFCPASARPTENPSGNSFGSAYTGSSDDDGDGEPDWVTERFDLSVYAGEEIWLRFEYVTDDAVNRAAGS